MAYTGSEKREHFPFMELSAELRLMIYRMALRHSGPLSLSRVKPKAPAQEEQTAAPGASATSTISTSSDDDDSVGTIGATRSPRGRTQTLSNRVALQARRIALAQVAAADLSTVADDVLTAQQASRLHSTTPVTRSARARTRAASAVQATEEPPPKASIDLVPNILCLNRQIFREARSVLYSENCIKLDLASSIYSVSSLRQQTRSLLKHIRVSIASYHDILDGFSDLVRLALRYCWGLQTLIICLPGGWPTFPIDSTADGKKGTSNVYANAFHILRWLPKTTKVVLEGDPSPEIRKVVEQCGRAAEELDEVSRRISYVRRGPAYLAKYYGM